MRVSSKSSDDGLGLSDQPLQGLLPALPLQLRSDHLPARPVVLVHPVPLPERRSGHTGVHALGLSIGSPIKTGGEEPVLTSFWVRSAVFIIFT